MKLILTINKQVIEITTDHPASSYDKPVVLLDGQETHVPVSYVPDACDCNSLLAVVRRMEGNERENEEITLF